MSDYPDGTLPISIIAYAITTLPVDISAQTIGNLTIDIAAQTIGDLNVNITNAIITITGSVTVSGEVSIKGDVNVTGSVTVSGEVSIKGDVNVTGTVSISGDVNVTGTVSISGDVNVTGAVTVSGSVTITSGAVTISTFGGTSIVIDKLTQEAVFDRRVTLSNDGGTRVYGNPTGTNRAGKWYPKGCRGFLEKIPVECYDTASSGGTATIYIAPYIGAGYLYSATITIPAGGALAFRDAMFKKMWNYDSLFIFAVLSQSELRMTYDTDPDPDCYESTDAGATWSHADVRYWFRAVYKGLTIGDLNVTGTVNVIAIPNSLGYFSTVEYASIDGGGTEDIIPLVYGLGELTALQFRCNEVAGVVTDLLMELHVVVDGVDNGVVLQTLRGTLDSVPLAHAPFSLVKVDVDTKEYAWAMNFKVPFNLSLHVYIENLAAAGNTMLVTGFGAYDLLK